MQQEYSGGHSATLRVGLPAVIGVQTASQPPRYVSGSKLRQAMSEPIAVVELTRRWPLTRPKFWNCASRRGVAKRSCWRATPQPSPTSFAACSQNAAS